MVRGNGDVRGELPNADVAKSHLSCLTIHHANISYRLGTEKLYIDPKTEKEFSMHPFRFVFCAAVLLGLSMASPASKQAESSEPINIESRRELFVDRLLVDRMENARFTLHPLVPAKDRRSGLRGELHYGTVLMDGDLFRWYGRQYSVPGIHWRKDGWGQYHLTEITVYAQSRDGVAWEEPELGIYKVEGWPKGNITLAGEFLVNHNFTPFIDARPGVPVGERYKGIGGERYPAVGWPGFKAPLTREHLREKYGPAGLYAYVSPDGLHWKKLRKEAIISETQGSFDSQNVAFWSVVEGRYVCYFRLFEKGCRAVGRSTSPDFLSWSKPVVMKGRLEKEQLYTNGTHAYFRAPHIYVCPATRLLLDDKKSNTRVILMTSRAGSDTYDRTFGQGNFLADPASGNRTNYIAWTNGAQTGPGELSFYSCLGQRYTLRLDGFGSIHADRSGGAVLTKPLTFKGKELELNFAAGAGGEMRVEIQDAAGKPLPGFGLDDCQQLVGDQIEQVVKWSGGSDLSKLAGKAVRLRFALRDADLYSIRFR